MSDHLLASADREEALSRAYVQAIAAAAGYVVSNADFDRDGVDITIGAGGAMRPFLDIQLKATINFGSAKDGIFRYPLKKRNFDLLRLEVMVPRILVILSLPRDQRKWVEVTTGRLILRHAAYWASLAGLPETSNKESVTISIYESNLFDVVGLKALMERFRTGTAA